MSTYPQETLERPNYLGSIESNSDSEQQQKLVEEVAPNLERLLIEFDTDKIEGTNNTVEFNREENRLTLVSNSSKEIVLDAEWDTEQDRWNDRGSSLTTEERDRIIGATEHILWEKESNEQQQKLVEEVAPHLIDVLNEFETNKYQGRNNTVEFNREENRLTLISNLSKEIVLDAEWDTEQDRWNDRGSSLTTEERDRIIGATEKLFQQEKSTDFER
ncbi:hypothetical protein [Okeania sp. SIO2B3]|uniref:hypothetical protein n=1 Tax=Okeania sp. SIO2B3 TaxID=2607784 RepID=UPI0013C145FC|nr:hypothetical protein [Okeania sp. SIO2B3]NET46881.1 hypothetical protein [Okeania sp. SIO2B3]